MKVAAFLMAPALAFGQRRAGEQGAGVARSAFPFSKRLAQPLAPQQKLAVLIEPAPKPAPRAEERLVRHLHGRSPGGRVAVERDETLSAERIEHSVDRGSVGGHRSQLVAGNTPAGVAGALAQGHQPQENLASRICSRRVETRVDLFGPSAEGARHPAQGVIFGLGQRRLCTALEELGQRVLEQRQRARLIGHLGHDVADQTWLERDTDPPRGLDDGVLQLLA